MILALEQSAKKNGRSRAKEIEAHLRRRMDPAPVEPDLSGIPHFMRRNRKLKPAPTAPSDKATPSDLAPHELEGK